MKDELLLTPEEIQIERAKVENRYFEDGRRILTDFHQGEITRDEALEQILALLIPDIEETQKQGFDEGVRKTTDAMDSTFSAQLEEERERIIAVIKTKAWQGHGPAQGFDPPKGYLLSEEDVEALKDNE